MTNDEEHQGHREDRESDLAVGRQHRSTDLAAVQVLVASVDGLRRAVESVVDRADKAERRVSGITFAIIADVLLTFAFAGLYFYADHTANALDDTRSQVLCPMYAAWLGSFNPVSRAAGQDRATYEDVFSQMRDAYQHLACHTALVPRPTTAPPPPPFPLPR